MPRWIARILYGIRGKRKVRLQLEDKPGLAMPAIEGIMLGRWGGHYILIVPKLIHGPEKSIALDGMVEVPAERVVFVQVMT